MSLLVKLDQHPTIAPDRLVSGDPSYKTWAQDESRGGTVKTGVWEAAPGENCSTRGDKLEFRCLVSGKIDVVG